MTVETVQVPDPGPGEALPLERFVSETIGLDDVEAAFEKMERGEVLRSVVLLPGSSLA